MRKGILAPDRRVGAKSELIKKSLMFVQKRFLGLSGSANVAIWHEEKYSASGMKTVKLHGVQSFAERFEHRTEKSDLYLVYVSVLTII